MQARGTEGARVKLLTQVTVSGKENMVDRNYQGQRPGA